MSDQAQKMDRDQAQIVNLILAAFDGQVREVKLPADGGVVFEFNGTRFMVIPSLSATEWCSSSWVITKTAQMLERLLRLAEKKGVGTAA